MIKSHRSQIALTTSEASTIKKAPIIGPNKVPIPPISTIIKILPEVSK